MARALAKSHDIPISSIEVAIHSEKVRVQLHESNHKFKKTEFVGGGGGEVVVWLCVWLF